jgi:radical SAM protein with 4Fe4S-binding SPASM domain
MAPELPGKIPRESENVLRLAEDLGLRRVAWQSRPTEIEFGFNNVCNLVCVMCHQADGIPPRKMPGARAEEALGQILPWALHLTPSDASEPLINDLDLLVRLCREHDVQLLMYCNATLLDEQTFRKIAPVTHRIWFSVDSADPATFEALRAGSRFDDVVANISAVMPLAAEARIEIGFNAVVMRPNWSHMPALVDFVADLGGIEMSMQELLPNSTGYEQLKIDGHVPEADFGSMVATVRERALARGVAVKLNLHQPWGGFIEARPPRQGSKAPLAEIRDLHMDSLARMHPGFCPMAMNYLKVTPDGAVYPCCRGPQELEMGNVLQQPFEAIWNGERYQEFRRRMFARDYPEVCRNCVVLTGPAHFPGHTANGAG